MTTCADEVCQLVALSEEVEGLEYLGFIPNAKVLLGVVHYGENASEIRYAIPSSWGSLHVSLGQVSVEERAEFLHDFKTQLENSR